MIRTLGVFSVFAISTGAAFSSGFFLLPGNAAVTGNAKMTSYLEKTIKEEEFHDAWKKADSAKEMKKSIYRKVLIQGKPSIARFRTEVYRNGTECPEEAYCNIFI